MIITNKMINETNETNETRKEHLINSIKDTDEEIQNLQVVIQGLDNLIFTLKDVDVKSDMLLLVDKYEKQIKFLEDIKDSDEQYLNLNLL